MLSSDNKVWAALSLVDTLSFNYSALDYQQNEQSGILQCFHYLTCTTAMKQPSDTENCQDTQSLGLELIDDSCVGQSCFDICGCCIASFMSESC